MLEFVHSSIKIDSRDIENKHGITLGLIDVTAAKTKQF
jgi:hypothetical protein